MSKWISLNDLNRQSARGTVMEFLDRIERKPIDIVDCFPASIYFAFFILASIIRCRSEKSLRSDLPAGVRETERVERVNNLSPISRSKEATCFVTACWLIYKFFAAAVKLRQFATSKKH